MCGSDNGDNHIPILMCDSDNGDKHLFCIMMIFSDIRIIAHTVMTAIHGPLSKRRGSEKKAYLGEMKAWLGSVVDICTSMCAYNMYYSGKLSQCWPSQLAIPVVYVSVNMYIFYSHITRTFCEIATTK